MFVYFYDLCFIAHTNLKISELQQQENAEINFRLLLIARVNVIYRICVDYFANINPSLLKLITRVSGGFATARQKKRQTFPSSLLAMLSQHHSPVLIALLISFIIEDHGTVSPQLLTIYSVLKKKELPA